MEQAGNFHPPIKGCVQPDARMCRMVTVLLGECFWGLSEAICESLEQDGEARESLALLELEQVRILCALTEALGGRVPKKPAYTGRRTPAARERLTAFCDRCARLSMRTGDGVVRATLELLREQKEAYLRRLQS